MYTTAVGATWAGTHTFRAHRLHTPSAIEEAADVIANSDRVRAVGTRHSFNDIADGAAMISMLDIEPGLSLDTEARTVWVAGGTRYGELAVWLETHGYALRNMGSLPHISIAGAAATGTHGSGDTNGMLATSINSLELITASGEIARFDRSHPDFPGMAPSMGSLGVVTRVGLDIEPTYLVRQDLYGGLDWNIALRELDSVMAAGYSVSLFTTWDEPTISGVLVKSRVADGGHVPDTLFGARSVRHGDPELGALGDNRTVLGGVPGPWLERLPHFRLDATPSHGDEIQSEYFVSRPDAPSALAALLEIGEDIARPLIASELRSVAADDRWMSPASGRDSLAIHFTWRNEPDAVAAILPRIEAALAPFRARPHWGKAFAMEAESIRPLYPRMDDFIALVHRVDPTGKFRNHYTQRVLGIRNDELSLAQRHPPASR